MPSPKKFCFVVRQAAQADIRVRELLDMALTTAAFDQTVTIVFLDDGVYQLLPRNHESAEDNVLQMIPALDLYDIEAPWVETESLSERGLTPADIAVQARFIARSELLHLFSEQNILASC